MVIAIVTPGTCESSPNVRQKRRVCFVQLVIHTAICLLSRYVTRTRCSGRKVTRFFCQRRTKYHPLKDRHHFGLPYVKNDLSCCGLKGGKTDTYHFRERRNIKKREEKKTNSERGRQPHRQRWGGEREEEEGGRERRRKRCGHAERQSRQTGIQTW